MNKTSIEWTHRPETSGAAGGFTWNPIRARSSRIGSVPRHGKNQNGTFCTRISPGCKNCYASVINKRFGTGAEYTVPNLADHEFYIDERILAEPIKRKKPATIFVGDMFDLFHEAILFSFVQRVHEAAVRCERHVFQFLTKRADRMLQFSQLMGGWPGNCWLGVSVEDQQRADERIPLLQKTPAAIRFLSVEPQLEEIWVENHLMGQTSCGRPNWVICGGESGPGARPFNLAWAESLLKQCKVAGVPYFFKQVGSNPVAANGASLKSAFTGKGGNIEEFPEWLRVREFPDARSTNENHD